MLTLCKFMGMLIEVRQKDDYGSHSSIENLRRGAMEKMGIGYDVLQKINPRVILACISGM